MAFHKFYQRTATQVDAYAEWIGDLIQNGWTGNIITLMYNQIYGGVRFTDDLMANVTNRVYSTMVRMMHRKPNAPGIQLPLMIIAKDWPVPKHVKSSLRDVMVNDGLHQHGLLLIPPSPRSRLKCSIQQHINENQHRYVADGILKRVHIEPFIDENHSRITGYTLKGLKQKRYNENELMIFPRSSGER